MRISNGFFVIENAKKIDGDKLRLKGHLLVDAVTDVDSSGGGSSGGSTGDLPPIRPLPNFEVKWILPPEESPAYTAIKATAQAAGYETVEHEDFSYPGR